MGFTSYKEIYFWLSVVPEISVSYTTVYRLVRQELEAKLKVPRPGNPRQLPGEVDEFKANLSKQLKALLDRESEKVKNYEKVSFWCEDESRFGCHTIARNKITLFGVKPIGNFQDNFQCFWLYGAVEPRQVRSFFSEFSHLDGHCFREYLLQLSQAFPDELHILQVDNAPAHIAGHLEIPDNILLFYQPSCCPEVNPATESLALPEKFSGMGNF